MKKLFTLFILAGAVLQVSAQRLLTEDFNYTTGQLTSAGSGANVSGGNWVDFSGTGFYIPVVAGNLSYPLYFTSPTVSSNSITTTATASSAEDAYTAFTTQTSGTVYASVLLKVTDISTLLANTDLNGDYHFGFLPSNSTTLYTARVSFRKGVGANTFNIGIRSSTSVSSGWAPADYAVGNTLLLTFAYQFITGSANDVEKLWVNPAYSPTEPTPLATSDFTTGGTESTDVTRLAIRQGTTTPGATIDAIIVSTSWPNATTLGLPITLSSFNASLVNGSTNLNWTVAQEINASGYSVERSGDATTFSEIGFVNATNAGSYSYVDATPLAGANYYRLKLVDKDGTFKYSNVVSVITGKATTAVLGVYPNPVVSTFTLTHPLAGNNATISIVSIDGKNILSQVAGIGATQSSVDVTRLVKGTYIVVFENNGTRNVTQFIK